MKSYLSVSTPLATAVFAAAFAASPALAAGESGMTVTRDAETGQLRAPTASEMKALEAARKPSSSRAATTPVEVRYADGTVGMTLGDDHMMYSVARVNAQGKVERVCVQGVEASQQAMKAPASVAARSQAMPTAKADPATHSAKPTKELPDVK